MDRRTMILGCLSGAMFVAVRARAAEDYGQGGSVSGSRGNPSASSGSKAGSSGSAKGSTGSGIDRGALQSEGGMEFGGGGGNAQEITKGFSYGNRSGQGDNGCQGTCGNGSGVGGPP